MHKLSSKRQVTLPKELCGKVGIAPGDMVEIFEYEGRITVIKQEVGASAGVLKHLKGNPAISDDESLQDTLNKKHQSKKGKKNKAA